MINNEFYKDLGARWYTSEGDVIALLRQENLAKLPWVRKQIQRFHAGRACRVLDVGCGGGFLTHELSADGHDCTGVDISAGVIGAAMARDVEARAHWAVAPAEKMPFPAASFDVVCVMDVLEHVQDFRQVIHEALRVLKPDGTLLLHTFNRTWIAWLIAERGVEWFIRGAPPHLHDWKLFVKPSEVEAALAEKNFTVLEWRGIGPEVFSRAFVELLCTRRVPKTFRFTLGKNLQLGYLAGARLKGNP